MLQNPFNGWYTDTVVIYRNQAYSDGNLDKFRRVRINAAPIPCRIFRSSKAYTKMEPQLAKNEPFDMLACDNAVDVQPGDELVVTRGDRVGGLGKTKYWAGNTTKYYEPYGNAKPLLPHQEVPLSGERRNFG